MINLLCFADNIGTSGSIMEWLADMIDKLHQKALAINMTFNVSKTVYMIFKPMNSRYMKYVITFQHSMRVGRYSPL